VGTPSSFISWFEELDIRSRPVVGGKGASLGELTRAGIRVPPGFVVSTAAFERFLHEVDPDDSIRVAIRALNPEDLTALSAATQQIRARIETSALPGDLQTAITEACGRLCGQDERAPVAVRSSATSEDSEEASFAGLQDTFLWVHGKDSILRSLRTCWASLYSVESVSYRLRLKLPEEHVAMGVVIQQMVRSRSSGVMFTRSPTTGDRSVITIEGSWGLGSCVVSGEVTPDKFVISKVTGEIVNRTVSQKTVQHIPDPHTGVGVCREPVPGEKQTAPCVSAEELAELARIARRVEQHYGCPQDIEWAIAHDASPAHGVYLLQSRPETVWAQRDKQPVAAPKAKPFDHVIAALSGRERLKP
jgi:pyruvate, water dikinase